MAFKVNRGALVKKEQQVRKETLAQLACKAQLVYRAPRAHKGQLELMAK